MFFAEDFAPYYSCPALLCWPCIVTIFEFDQKGREISDGGRASRKSIYKLMFLQSVKTISLEEETTKPQNVQVDDSYIPESENIKF